MLRYKQPKGVNEIKLLTGENGFKMIAEFNNSRGFNKRPRPAFESVSLPFDDSKFNFNKIKPEEILFALDSFNPNRGTEVLALVNISPINFCHNLYIIDPKDNHPQRLNNTTCRVAYDLVRLSNQPGFRTMFNSLQAWASVNHCHIHSMNVPYQLGMDICPSLPLNNRIRLLDPEKSLFKGFCINSQSEDDIEEAVILIDKIICYFHEINMPYNAVWSRGSDYINEKLNNSLVRFYLWPRISGEGL